MAETLSLMEFLQALLADAELRGSFGDDPHGTLVSHGLAELSPADVHDALVLVQDSQTVDFTLDPAGTPAPPPPPPAGDDHEAAVEYLARYLADPRPTAADETWADLDPDAAVPTATDHPGGELGTGFDDGYGTGTNGSPAEHGRDEHDPEWIDLAGYGTDATTHSAADGPSAGTFDTDGYADLRDLGDYDDLDPAELDGDDPGATVPD
jgi:hypothetical protein